MSQEKNKFSAIEIICEKLSERNAVLFLGAGINAGVKNEKGGLFPLSQELSDQIARDLLGDENLNLTLDEATEMARYKLGKEEVNNYLYRLFSSYRPGTAHLTLVQLPWDVIYTTNFDLLVESAAENASITPAGNIKVVCSLKTELAQFKEEDIIYYKLHGSIDLANTKDGKLILTKEDYRHYLSYRKTLFKRLERDLLNRTFVFIGYALRDPNFRAILEDCRDILGTETLPLSFAVRNKILDVEKIFWKEKYNIQLIEADGSKFLLDLNKTWIAQERTVIPLESRRIKKYMQIDDTTRLPKIGESFYAVRPKDCSGPSNPKLFFRGAEPSWGDIREKIAPNRDIYWVIFEALFPDLVSPHKPPSAYLITGSAGTGKTTLINTLVFDLANEFNIPILIHIPGTPLELNLLGPLVDKKDPKRIIIIIKYAAESLSSIESFLDEAKKKSFPVTLILEERKNQWIVAIASKRSRLTLPEFELLTLSHNEIQNILDSLKKYDLLGKLTGSNREEQIAHFTSLADKDLLVALRELTTDGTFDEIIKDEFNKIPSKKAKLAYIYVSALSQLDLAIRYETLVHILELDYSQLRTDIFRPTEGVLISGEESGSSRHNIGFRIRTRHPIIASIIFSTQAPDDETKFEIINNILSHLDAGYSEDKRLFFELTRRRDLVKTLESPEKRRAVYERLHEIMPDNQYVLQHRSILEKELNNPKLAVKFAQESLKYDRDNQTLLNTLGLAFEFEARSTTEPLKWKSLIQSASKIFNKNIQKTPTDPYGYIGQVYIMRQHIKKETDSEKKSLLYAEALSYLEEAYEATQESSIIASELAIQRKALGDRASAIDILNKALNKKRNDIRLRDILIRFLFDDDLKEAIRLAQEGIRLNPTAWRFQRHIARIKKLQGEPIDAVKGFYEAAIRHQKGDINLLVELGAFLFMNKKYFEANEIFNQARQLQITGYEKHKIREIWTDTEDDKIIFSGKVKAIEGAAAFAIAIPENFEAFFFKTTANLLELKKNDPIKFWVGFNAWGAVAKIIQ